MQSGLTEDVAVVFNWCEGVVCTTLLGQMVFEWAAGKRVFRVSKTAVSHVVAAESHHK